MESFCSNHHLLLRFRVTTTGGQPGCFTVCPVCQQPWTLPLLFSFTKHSPSNLQERPWPEGARGWPPHGTFSFFFFFFDAHFIYNGLKIWHKTSSFGGWKKETFQFGLLCVQDLHKGCLCLRLTVTDEQPQLRPWRRNLRVVQKHWRGWSAKNGGREQHPRSQHQNCIGALPTGCAH